MSEEIQISEEEIYNTNIMAQNIIEGNMQNITISFQDEHGIYQEHDLATLFENIDHEEIQWTGQYVDQSDMDIAIDLNEVSDNNISVQH
jgi:hypothetical protein